MADVLLILARKERHDIAWRRCSQIVDLLVFVLKNSSDMPPGIYRILESTVRV
jgi:hypothetical protein